MLWVIGLWVSSVIVGLVWGLRGPRSSFEGASFDGAVVAEVALEVLGAVAEVAIDALSDN